MYHPAGINVYFLEYRTNNSNCSKFAFIPMPHFKDDSYGHLTGSKGFMMIIFMLVKVVSHNTDRRLIIPTFSNI